MQPIHIAENLVWFNEKFMKFRAKVGQNVTSTGIIISANVSKDTMYGIQ